MLTHRGRLIALLAVVTGLVAAAAFAYFAISAPRDSNLATSGLLAVVRAAELRVVDADGANAGVVDHLSVDGHVSWTSDATSLGYARGDTLYWSPTNLQFSRKVGTIVPGSRFFWSPTGKEVLVQTSTGIAIIDKAGKQRWKFDGVQPLGWWPVTGLVGSAVVASDGTGTRILSTYNNEALWTFDAPMAIPSLAGTTLLLRGIDGWSVWEPLTGRQPISGVTADAGATAAWAPDGRRVAIESPATGGFLVVDIANLSISGWQVPGHLLNWVGSQIAVSHNGQVSLINADTGDALTFDGVSSVSPQPPAPRVVLVPKPGRVKFVPAASLRGGGVPVAVAPHPNGRILYIADLTGRIVADVDGTQTTLLDIRDQVTTWDESGLLDIVLNPKFPQDRTAYVYYGAGGVTDKGDRGPRRNLIGSFEIASDGTSLVPDTFRVRHSIPTPQQTPMAHNGGTLAFAPDGSLYLGIGDLGDHEAAANPAPGSLSGAFFVFDVSQPGEWTRTKVAHGFRNPFRFSIDPVTAQVWIGDVGGTTREEIDLLTRGGNFGWPLREGEICRTTLTDCGATGLAPIHAWYPYSPDRSCGAGVIGGYVYRGTAMPDLRGWYLYSDLCSGDILAIDPAAKALQPITLGRTPGAPAWGTVVDLTPDARGEPLVVSMTGAIWRLEPGN